MTQRTPPPDINLVSYRLREIESNLEKNIEKLSNKIDLILVELNKTTVVQSENKIKVEKLEADVLGLIKADETIKEDVVKLKVSVAEKLSWGAVGGGISAIIIKLIGTSGG